MTTEIDMLQNLEKQSQNYPLSMDNNEKQLENSYTPYTNNGDVMLARLASAVHRRCTFEEDVDSKHSKSVKGLVHSTSTSRRKYLKNGIPPVPPLPKNLDDIQPVTPVPPLPDYIEQVTPKTDTLKQASRSAESIRSDEIQQKPTLVEPTLASPQPSKQDVPVQKERSVKEDGRKEENGSSALKTVHTRVFINDANSHVTLQLNPLLTSGMVIQYLKKKNILDSSADWTLFEIANSHQVERPFREWEHVLGVVATWDPDDINALLIKKYAFHYTLTSEIVFQKPIQMHGWLSIEYKKGKWQKRYCHIKENAIHHAKDKSAPSSILCHLASYDVYTLLQSLPVTPTPYVFAIRAQNRASIFENEGDYIRFMATEDPDEMKHWVLSIRHHKSMVQYQHRSQRAVYPTASEETREETMIRRQKSIKNLTASRSESAIRSDPKPKIRTNTLHRSATVKETADSVDEQSPLIQIDDEVKFAKGSLLAKKMPEMIKRSKSVREIPAERTPDARRYASLRKPKFKKPAESVPLPSNNNTLLQLDDSPESFHSKELKGRHVKPLLSFDPPSPSTRK